MVEEIFVKVREFWLSGIVVRTFRTLEGQSLLLVLNECLHEAAVAGAELLLDGLRESSVLLWRLLLGPLKILGVLLRVV